MILAVLFFATILRLISLNQSLWLDEAINVLAAKDYSLVGMVTEYAKGDFHPPGYFIILWTWTKIFGYSEIAVRMPSVIFGLLTIWIVYLIGRKLHSNFLGLIMALFLAINPLHIYYSQETRMYSLATLAVCLNMWFFLKFIKAGQENRGSWIYYILSNLLVLMSDYVAYLIFPAQFIFLLLSRQTNYLKKWLAVSLIALASSSIWLPIFLKQLEVGMSVSASVPAWKEVVGSFGLKPLILTFVKFIIGRIDHPNNLIYGLLFLLPGLLFLFLIWKGIKSVTQFNRIFLLTWIVMPVGSALLISMIVPIYSYFRLLFVLPAFILLLSLGVLSFKSPLRNTLISLVILVEIISVSLYLFNNSFQREDWKGLVSYLAAKSNSQILFESTGKIAPFTYYADDRVQVIFPLIKFPAKDLADIADLKLLLNEKRDIYLVDYLVEISDPNRLVRRKLLDLGYRELDVKNFPGVGFVYQFKKE